MTNLKSAAASFFREAPALYRASTSTEKSYYPGIKELWARLLESRGLPFEVRAETSEARAGGGTDHPDLALYDRGDFLAVVGEVKTPDVDIPEMAASTDGNDQIGRYLAQTGVVLLCNVRAVGLLACKPRHVRRPGKPVPPEARDLLDVVHLWPSEAALVKGQPVAPETLDALADLLERAVTEFAPIAEPATLARILARQARKAKSDLPDRFDAVAGLLDDYHSALGLSFDVNDEKGADFFRNPEVYLSNVPEAVWRYELGGYPVIKKWLGYRHDGRAAGRPLTLPEARHLCSMVQRLAALLVLHEEMDALYEKTAADAFTAEDLGLRS